MPEKLKQMQDPFIWRRRNTTCCRSTNSTLARFRTPRPSLTAGRTVFTYTGGLTGVPNSGAPHILNKSYAITARSISPQAALKDDRHRRRALGGYALFLSKVWRAFVGQAGFPL